LHKPHSAEQICRELARTVGADSDSCVLAWEGEEAPRVVYATGNTESVLRAKAGALFGVPAGSLFAGGERTAKDLIALCASVPAADQRSMLREGRPFPAQLLLRGVPAGAVALVRDLTAAGEQADVLLRTDDLARFASLVAHEIRNPLSAVKIALQTLERHGTLGQNDLRRTGIALREVQSIELLLNEVLEFARPPSLALVPADPRTAVEEGVAAAEIEWNGRVAFARRFPMRMAPSMLDPVRVRTAARILCQHGAVAADEVGGGPVEVALRETSPGWELSVGSPGLTLSPERRRRAFTPFNPERARGSGLGLAVVLRVAREHQGDARMDARPGGGNVITVAFADQSYH
jgi:signal transduction histidine kinase